MKKTKINVGAILLIVYATLALLLANLVPEIVEFALGSSYGAYGSFGTLIGAGQVVMWATFIVTVAFGIVMLCGKRWGSVALGASMATTSVVAAVPMLVLSGIINCAVMFSLMYGYTGSDMVVTAIVIWILLGIFLLFITLPAFAGWGLYTMAGAFSNAANNKDKKSVTALVLKIVASALLVIAGYNQLTYLINICFIVFLAAGISTVIEFVVILIFIFGVFIVLALVSLPILAAGIVLSIKYKPDDAPCRIDEKEQKGEEPEGELEILPEETVEI